MFGNKVLFNLNTTFRAKQNSKRPLPHSLDTHYFLETMPDPVISEKSCPEFGLSVSFTHKASQTFFLSLKSAYPFLSSTFSHTTTSCFRDPHMGNYLMG